MTLICVEVRELELLISQQHSQQRAAGRITTPTFGLYTILPLPILYNEWQHRGGGGNHILRNIHCEIHRGGLQ